MRATEPSDAWFGPALAGLACVTCVLLGSLAWGSPGAAGGLVLGVALAASAWLRLSRRGRSRRRLLATPFPSSRRDAIERRVAHYRRLDANRRRRFEADLTLFLAEKRITGVGTEVDDELRVLVAASAVTLSLGWPAYEWDQLTEVLVYPDDFDRDDHEFDNPELAGEAHPWGTVILSAPALEESFDDPRDGYNVGFHEFAHLLDLQHGEFGGVPAGLGEEASRRWIEVMDKELDRLRRGRSILDPYGAENSVELFAVAVEAFFELPERVRRRHPDLYALLAAFFAQDPAAWDTARRPPA